jgi:hypothetical protein
MPAIPALPAPVVEALTNLKHAGLVARCAMDRYALLPEIVSLHTRKELADAKGLSPAGARLIERWLRQQGRRLRHSHESLDAVICAFGVRRLEAVRAQIRSGVPEMRQGG